MDVAAVTLKLALDATEFVLESAVTAVASTASTANAPTSVDDRTYARMGNAEFGARVAIAVAPVPAGGGSFLSRVLRSALAGGAAGATGVGLDDVVEGEVSDVKTYAAAAGTGAVFGGVVGAAVGLFRSTRGGAAADGLPHLEEGAPRPFEKVPYGETDLSKAAQDFRLRTEPGTGRNVAIVEIMGEDGPSWMARPSTGRHSEAIILDELDEAGVDASRVTRLYSELEPCNVRYRMCGEQVRNRLPQTQVTFSFDYADPLARETSKWKSAIREVMKRGKSSRD